MSVKENKITRKDPLSTRNGAYNNKLDVLFLVFNEHEKDISTLEIFFMFRSIA